MKSRVIGLVATLCSGAAFGGASVDESALAICAKNIKNDIGLAHYTTFDKQVGIVRDTEGGKKYFINATYKSPEMSETKSFRAVCDGNGFMASVEFVVEGSWSFTGENSLSQQLASINF